MIKCVVGILFFFFAINAYSQYDPEKVNAKAREVYDKAINFLEQGRTREAIPFLQSALEKDGRFLEAYLSLASAKNELKQYNEGINHFEKANAIDSDFCKYYQLIYSINLAGAGRFTDALQAVEKYASISSLNERSKQAAAYRIGCYRFAVEQQKKQVSDPYHFAPQNLGDSINSKYAEYYPSFTIDGKTFVFTRRGAGIRENFMASSHATDHFANAFMMHGMLNEEPSKGAIQISQDGEWLVFAGNFPGRGFGDFDIYTCYNTPQGWSEPLNLGDQINTDFWESAPTLSSDKNTLYFSSNRSGGFGGKDLYVSYRKPNGKWSAAKNMGALINSKGDEEAPFIHADNRTLYFTSNGLQGYGGTDIFMVKRNEDSAWNKPENAGYPINTIENEGSLYVTADGNTAYYASDRADSRGMLDLYTFEMPEHLKPVKTLYVQGIVSDAVTKKNIPCTVELTDNNTQKMITKTQTDETGFYFITLPVGNDYTFTVNRKGYLFYSNVFALSKNKADSIYTKDIALEPITLHATEVFRNIQFRLNSAELETVSIIELSKLLQLMNDNPSVTVLISGHTDNTGTDASNIKLSEARAKAVANYLFSNGIAAARLSWKGFGSSRPVSDNNTDEGRTKNRRTEFTITGL